MTDVSNDRAGGCHCGAVRFVATVGDTLDGVWRCTCSYCAMRGAVIAAAPAGGLRFLSGEELLTSYRFHTGAAQHFFCSRCGIATHLRRRSDPNGFGINVACLDGISPFDFPAIPVNDGLAHPGDVGGEMRRAGTLLFVPDASSDQPAARRDASAPPAIPRR